VEMKRKRPIVEYFTLTTLHYCKHVCWCSDEKRNKEKQQKPFSYLSQITKAPHHIMQ